MRFPLNLIFKPLGGVGIDRSPKVPGQAKKGMVETMAALYEKNPGLVLLVTPEGTRKKSEKWKTGFYHVATLANVPILLGYVDYKNKEAGIGKVIYPAKENFEKDMREIMAFYAEKQAKFPQSFSLDLEFADKK